MKMSVKYRQFEPSDSEVVTQLIQSLYLEDPGGLTMTPQKIQNTFESFAKHPDRGSIMVLEYDTEVIGYAILVNFWNNEFGGNITNIDELYIKKEFRSQGIGTNFIKFLSKHKPHNSVALQLEVSPQNKKAQKLYKSLGFRLHENATYDLMFEPDE